MQSTKPGEWVDVGAGLADIDFGRFRMSIPTDRYTSAEFAEREREGIWQRVLEYLGQEVAELLAPYHLDKMVTVLDVREALDCNWKVVMDAFEEGYHISGIHPQLLRVIMIWWTCRISCASAPSRRCRTGRSTPNS
ncbi:hypothetical protein NRB20_56280 [Nocardia sp. RB20]|uniref:Aromatic-ring-hydroxylating dioxygenase alpha subunit C-terminal domain-containing protein n=1 Tax=Nocardia macrotermitis TaxID=2585198 RepID=A0A7K0D9R3_9NOCA|nr:hypothetical protein [Nocardia macrotermitis]